MLKAIKSKGEKFIPNIFTSVKQFQLTVFETTIMLYDPNLDGLIEGIEGQIDQEITNIIIKDQLYFLLLVFARIQKSNED